MWEERAPQGHGPLVRAGKPKPLPEEGDHVPGSGPTLANSLAETGAVGLAALTPAVIQQLHGAIRGLPPPQFEELVTAFRQRFRLAEGASVAAEITQKKHHD